MKSWRTWLLLLLAVLLPVRAAVAAAMLCPVAGSGAQVEVAILGHAAGHAAVDDTMSHHPASHHPASHHQPGSHDQASGHGQAADHPGHDHVTSEACNACAAYCSLTPFLGSPTSLEEPLEPTTVSFADLSAPPPTFVSEGQERPPRTI